MGPTIDLCEPSVTEFLRLNVYGDTILVADKSLQRQ